MSLHIVCPHMSPLVLNRPEPNPNLAGFSSKQPCLRPRAESQDVTQLQGPHPARVTKPGSRCPRCHGALTAAQQAVLWVTGFLGFWVTCPGNNTTARKGRVPAKV